MNPLPYEYNAALARVIDGDTIVVKVDLGFRVVLEQVVRVYGVNTPEIVGPDRARGLAAKAAVEGMLAQAVGPLRLRSHKPDARDKYGRFLAEVLYEAADGVAVNLGAALVAQGLAVAYFG